MTFQIFSQNPATSELLRSVAMRSGIQLVDVEHFYDILSCNFFSTVYNSINIYNYLSKSCGFFFQNLTSLRKVTWWSPIQVWSAWTSCAPCWTMTLMRVCSRCGANPGSGLQANLQGVCSWLCIKVTNTLPTLLQCQKAFPDTFALDFSASHHGTIMAAVLLQTGRRGWNSPGSTGT